mmetsp:Transcript_29238/g.95393  ORF Transcript_29238/g.95393 Transcript_29238/m.95393 type:complete len:220 (-) Transcript_29238:64-723(-)
MSCDGHRCRIRRPLGLRVGCLHHIVLAHSRAAPGAFLHQTAAQSRSIAQTQWCLLDGGIHAAAHARRRAPGGNRAGARPRLRLPRFQPQPLGDARHLVQLEILLVLWLEQLIPPTGAQRRRPRATVRNGGLSLRHATCHRVVEAHRPTLGVVRHTRSALGARTAQIEPLQAQRGRRLDARHGLKRAQHTALSVHSVWISAPRWLQRVKLGAFHGFCRRD